MWRMPRYSGERKHGRRLTRHTRNDVLVVHDVVMIGNASIVGYPALQTVSTHLQSLDEDLP